MPLRFFTETPNETKYIAITSQCHRSKESEVPNNEL